MFVGATAGGTEKAGGMAIVEMHDGPVFRGERVHFVEAGDDAIHREHAIGGDELHARAFGIRLLELGFEVGHVVVRVAVSPGLAEAHAVDDRCVVELVGNDGVVRT